MKHAIRHIHFVGLGGSGMSGIAEVLFNLGYRISGSDLSDSPTLHRLQALGIATYLGHAAAHIEGADAVVTSTAVKADNPEVLAAREKKIPVVPRALMLAAWARRATTSAACGCLAQRVAPQRRHLLRCPSSPHTSAACGGRLAPAAFAGQRAPRKDLGQAL